MLLHQQVGIVHAHFNTGAKQEWKGTSRQCVENGKGTHLHGGWPNLAAHLMGAESSQRFEKGLDQLRQEKSLQHRYVVALAGEALAGKPHYTSACPWVPTESSLMILEEHVRCYASTHCWG